MGLFREFRDFAVKGNAVDMAIGIATDEIRRHGLNIEKRARLVKAGAHIIVPDFSQHGQLARLLFESSPML